MLYKCLSGEVSRRPFKSLLHCSLRLWPLGLSLWLRRYDRTARKISDISVVLFAVDIANLSKQHLALKVERQCGWPNCGRLLCMWLLGEDAKMLRRFCNFLPRVVRFVSFLLLVTLSPTLFALTRALYH